LAAALTTTKDLVLLQIIIEALGRVGGRAMIGDLDRIAKTHEDLFIQKAAREAREEIQKSGQS
jgi:hypothetical protein